MWHASIELYIHGVAEKLSKQQKNDFYGAKTNDSEASSIMCGKEGVPEQIEFAIILLSPPAWIFRSDFRCNTVKLWTPAQVILRIKHRDLKSEQ